MSRRVVGVDVARAVALVGMMGTHLLPELGDDGRVRPWFWFAAGRSSALFAVLAGVGLALATGGATPRLQPWRATVARTVVRGVLVAALGMLLVELDPPIAVILTNYGLLFVLALPLLGLRPATLLRLAAAWVVVVPLLSQAWRAHRPPGPGQQLAFGDLAHPVGLLERLAVTGYYPVLTWTAYLAVGIAVGRMPLREKATAPLLLVGGLALAVGSWVASWLLLDVRGFAGLASSGPPEVVAGPLGLVQLELRGLYGTTPTTSWWWQAVASPHSGTPFDLAGTVGSALVVLALALLAVRAVATLRGPLAWVPQGVVGALAAAGSMTLTLYSLHVVAADAQRDVLGRSALLAAHVGVALLVAVLWRRWAARGPLEQVVHDASRLAGRVVS
ncbi:hypothetical protein GCM10027446_16220 [Angustibacter peucedani]